MIRGKILKGLAAIIVPAFYLWPVVLPASPLSFSGEVSHQHSDSEDVTAFKQTTSVDLSQDLTSLMRLNETIRYSSAHQDGRKTESITPTVDFTVTNDIFRFSLSGTANKRLDSERADRTNQSWETRIASTWQKNLWPQLQVSYGQDFVSDDQSPPQLDSVSDQASLNLDWDLLLAKLYYTIDHNETENEAENSNSLSTSQLARISTRKSFFNNMVDVSLVQQYSRDDREFTTTIGEEGFALLPVTLIAARGGWPTAPDGSPDYEEEPDWDELGAAFPEPVVNERYNLALQLNGEEVDTVYLYTATDLSDEALLFEWDLYSSSDGEIWKQEESSVSMSYNRSRQRFELEFSPVEARYLMLVEHAYPLLDTNMRITEIETFSREFGATGERVADTSVKENYLSNAALRWQLMREVAFNYNITFEQVTGSGSSNDADTLNHSASFNWEPQSNLSSTVSASESRDRPEDDNETSTRSYALSLTYNPLSTLNFNLGVTRSENYQAGVRDSTSHSYNMYTTAEIYPDLTSSLDLIYSTAEHEENDRSSSNFNARWKITTRLIPDLTVDFGETYAVSDSEGSTSTSFTSNVNVSWRPSAMYSLNAGAKKSWKDKGESPFTYNLAMNLAPTEKNQVSMGYSHSSNSDDYRANWNWTINSIFSFSANCGYTEGDEDSAFSYGSRLTVRY